MNNVLKDCREYCSGCGLCAAVCPVKAICLKAYNGVLRPQIDEKCINCGKCRKFCPNLHMEKYSYNDFLFYHWGHSTNASHRYESASGGITSELLFYLVKEGYVDYVITADEYYDNHNVKYCIPQNDEIFQKAGSNYCPVNIGSAVSRIKKMDGTCAIVCLPCLARGIRKLCENDNMLAKKVKYIITLLCNHVPSYNATEYLKERYKVKKPDKIKYRGNGWFGFLRMLKKEKDEYSEFFSIGYSQYFSTGFSEYFWQSVCAKCNDHFGKYADVAMGDADFVKYRNDNVNYGETMCFVNNSELNNILLDMCKKGIIELSEEYTNEEMELIYGPLCTLPAKVGLEQNYKKVLYREKLNDLCGKFFSVLSQFKIR